MSNTIPIKKPELIPVDTIKPFTRFCCSIGMIPSSYKASMSYEEQLMWLCHFLEDTLLPTVNTNTESFLEIEALFEQLYDYVEHYFDNLDVQQEINNKLDEMAEDGTLENIVGGFINNHFIQYFDTVADLKNANLSSGQIAGTKGYYAINDGGEAKYQIVNDNTLVDDGGSVHNLTNGNKAKLIIKDETINIRQLGAIPSDSYNIKTQLDVFENLCIQDNKQYTLFIPQGDWYSSAKQFTYTLGLKIVGTSKAMKGKNNQGTTLHNYNDIQEYLLKIGNNTDESSIAFTNLMTNYSLENLVFEGSFTNSALVICGLMYSHFGFLNFRMITNGHCISISSSWELDFDYIAFRVISSLQSAIYFDKIYSITGVASNCSALYFNYLNFEGLNCTAIETNPQANFVHNEFNIIEYERSFASTGATNNLPEGITEDDCVKIFLFKGYFDKTTINSINHNNTANVYLPFNNQYIFYCALFTDNLELENPHQFSAYNNYHISVANILLTGNRKSYLLESSNTERTSLLTIGTIHQRDQGEKIFNGNKGIILKIGNINNSANENKKFIFNTLMQSLETFPKNINSFNPFTLINVEDSIDITECAIYARATAPMPCKGLKNLKILCKLIDSSTKENKTGIINLGYRNPNISTSYNNQRINLENGGLNSITIDFSELNATQYTLSPLSTQTDDLLIYAIEYSF